MAGGQHRLALVASAVLVLLVALLPRSVEAFGDSGAFHPRVLLVGEQRFEGPRTSAPGRWAWELTRRTSAPARLATTSIRADSSALLAEPFALWFGEEEVKPLTPREVRSLRGFFGMGGLLVVDDTNPASGVFGRSARRELGRVLTDSAPIPIGPEHVVFRSYYLLSRPVGRVKGPPKLEAIIRGGHTRVILSSHDLTGALAQDPVGTRPLSVVPGGEVQREMATRLAVNIAMFVLCSNYKDDQVHAPFLMRRRARHRR